MAIASVGTLGTGVSITSTTSFTLVTATNALAAGDFALLTVTTANDSTNVGVGQSGAHIKITGGTGFWVKWLEYTSSAGVAGDGVTESLWVFFSTGTNAIGTTFTVTLNTAVVDKVVCGWKFTKGAGTAIRLVRGAVSPIVPNAQAAANGYGSVAFAGMASGSRLYARALGKKANTTTAITPSTSFTVITGTRSRNNAAAVFGSGEFRINTSTGETSNPTQAVSGPTAGVFVALEEYTPSPAIFAAADVSTSSCFKNAACTTAVTADGDEVLGVKDPTTGLILNTATAGSGPLYRTNSGKPYLECSSARFFDPNTGGVVQVGDNVGEYMIGAAVRFDDIIGTSNGPGALTISSGGRPFAAIRAASSAVSAWAYSSDNSSNFDGGPALTVSTDCVISAIVSQSGFEVFLNGVGNGAAGLANTPFSGGSNLNIGNGPFVDHLVGRLYGVRLYQGQDTTTHTAMVASLNGLLSTSDSTVALAGQSIGSTLGSLLAATALALTGAALAGSQGSVAPQTSRAVSGQSLAAAQGSAAASVTVALTGQSLSVAQGTVLQGAPLVGQSANVAQGSTAPVTTVGLTGQSLTIARGAVAPATSQALAGQALSAAGGSLAPAAAQALSGQATSIARGSISPGASAGVAGQGLTTATGSLVAAPSLALTGLALVAARGTVTANVGSSAVTVALTGQSVSGAQGSLSAAFAPALAGQALAVRQGTFALTVSPAITGQESAAQIEQLAPASSFALVGGEIAASCGTLVLDFGAPLDGQALITGQGISAPNSILALLGVGVVGAQGDVEANLSDVTVALTGLESFVAQNPLTPQSITALLGFELTSAGGAVAVAIPVPEARTVRIGAIASVVTVSAEGAEVRIPADERVRIVQRVQRDISARGPKWS